MTTTHAQGKCPRCKKATRVTMDEAMEARWQVRCECRAWVVIKPIHGVRTESPCDARCTSAKGHDCECSCGGENHGADHDMVMA